MGVGAAYLLAEVLIDGPILLATVPADTRESLFVSLSATAGALLGFAITGLTVLLTLGGGPRMDWLKSNPSFRDEVRRLFITAIASLGIATVAFLFLLIVGTGKHGMWVGWGALSAALVALIVERVWRLVAFFNKLMPLALKDTESKRLPNPPMVGSPDD